MRRELNRLATRMLFGTLSERYHTCGQQTCRCHQGGPKHGPQLQVSYRSRAGKTAGYYVPQDLADPVRTGVAAWPRFLAVARELAELNRERVWRRPARG